MHHLGCLFGRLVEIEGNEHMQMALARESRTTVCCCHFLPIHTADDFVCAAFVFILSLQDSEALTGF